MRKWVEDDIHYFSIGRFAAGSERERRLVLLAQALDQYSNLLNQVVTEQLVDSITRRVNRKLIVENEQLTLEIKRLTFENEQISIENKRLTSENEQISLENKQLEIQNKFLYKEAVYYKLAQEKESSIAKKFFSWAIDYIIKMKGQASS